MTYVEETCYHVVPAGLQDQDLRDRALTQTMLGTIKDLPTLINFTTAEESARAKDSNYEAGGLKHNLYLLLNVIPFC